MKFTVHGIEFERAGSCNRCGECNCAKCPHHIPDGGGSLCAIYDSRHLECKPCSEKKFNRSVTHQGCIIFPDNPWINVIRRGVCGYTFKRTDGGSMDDLPFVDGKFKIE